MTRKNVLKGLLEGPGAQISGQTPGQTSGQLTGQPPAPPFSPRPTGGAIGAVGRSIADLRARAVIDIDPFLIDAGGLADRLESDDAEDRDLARSIAEHGQQVPVLVRPHPETPGRFQIVYGRRRVLALRDLGQPVKALVRDLDDRALVLAQGQENNARRNLSFIERVNFARQMEEAGYDRAIICDALAIDKTTVSRMLAVASRVPRAVIEAVGAAPSVGRDRWLSLADLIAEQDIAPEDIIVALAVSGAVNSDARFEAAIAYLTGREKLSARRSLPPATPPGPGQHGRTEKRPLRGHDGQRLGQISRGAESVTLRFDLARSNGFEDWLLANLADLHRRWDESILPGSLDDKAE